MNCLHIFRCGSPEFLIQASIMFDLDRCQCLRCRTIQILVHHCHFIGDDSVIYSCHMITELVFCCKSYNFFFNLSSRNHGPRNFIAQYVFFRNCLGSQCKIDLICCVFIDAYCSIISDCFYISQTSQAASAIFQTIHS